MMGVSDQLASAIQASDLGWSDLRTRPVEYVASMAAATGLGSDLFRLRSHDRAAASRAVLLLARKAWRAGHAKKLPISDAQARALSIAAIIELSFPHCQTCRGAGESIVEKLKVICPTCSGTRLHRYSDQDRAKMCGIPFDRWDKFESRYLMVLSIAMTHDTAAARAKGRLG